MSYDVIDAHPIDMSMFNMIDENPSHAESMKMLTLWLSNEQSENSIKFNSESESAIIRIRFKGDMFQLSHIILKGFNISKFELDAGLMDD